MQAMVDKVTGRAKGGIARAKKLTPEERTNIASKAAQARWTHEPGTPKATHVGNLKIGDLSIPCAVLEDGTRVLSERSVARSLGSKGAGAHWKKKKTKEGAILPEYVSKKYLAPHITDELKEKLINPISYISKSGSSVQGISAKLLPEICNIWLKAREKGAFLNIPQEEAAQKAAKKAELLMRGLAHVGIIALVDEATGYQDVRDRVALQEILNKYINDEWAKWTKTFPDVFYKELFRLKGVAYPTGSSGKKPSYVGHWTNDIIYSRLAPGVLKALKEKNPRTSSGNREHKHHQFLTRDYGHPELKELLSNAIFLMKGCTSWADFKQRLDRAKTKFGDTMPLDF